MRKLLESINIDKEPDTLSAIIDKKMQQEQLKALRHKLGLNQREFAEAIGTGKDVVSRWESGKHKISKSYAALIQTKWVKELNNLLLVREK